MFSFLDVDIWSFSRPPINENPCPGHLQRLMSYHSGQNSRPVRYKYGDRLYTNIKPWQWFPPNNAQCNDSNGPCHIDFLILGFMELIIQFIAFSFLFAPSACLDLLTITFHPPNIDLVHCKGSDHPEDHCYRKGSKGGEMEERRHETSKVWAFRYCRLTWRPIYF